MSIEQLTSSRRWRLGLAVIVLFTVVAALWPVISPSAQPLGGGAAVHGTVQADLGTGSGPALPDASVVLRGSAAGSELARVSTNLGGFFMLPEQPAGVYELCVEAQGFSTNCRSVEVGSELVTVGPLAIAPAGPVIAGRARLANGSPCVFNDPSFGLSFETTVSSAARGQVVRANLAGEFVLPVSPAGSAEVIARCQAAQATLAVGPIGPVTPAELVFDNRPPEVGLVYASQGGSGVRIAAPRAAVDVFVEAEDPDGQPLSYTWVVTGSAEGFTSENASTVPWTLPNGPGLHTAYVLVTDGHGGVAFGRADVSTDDQGALFAGVVREAGNGQPVAGAAVSVNGASATTDADGGFYVFADPAERYVITIEQRGYQLLSEVVYGDVPDGVYELVRSRTVTFEAEAGGLLVEPQGPWGRGAQIILEPGSLVRPNGAPASGLATAYIATVDLRDPADRFPGEYAGSDNGETPAGLVSVGAVDVQLFSADGERLNIAPGREATVRIPVDPIQLGLAGTPTDPPAVVPIWFYNPRTGVWDREGQGTLSGPFYETRVRHFSVINADITFTNPACLRVITNFNFLRFPYKIRVSVPAVNPTRIITGTVDNFISVVTYLPPFTQIKVEALDSAGNPIQTSARTVTTGGTSAPMPGAWPYFGCTSVVLMTLVVPPGTRFLEYFYNLNTAAEADAYYAAIDPIAVNGAGTIRTFIANLILGTGTGFGIVQPGHLIRAGGQTRLVTNVLSATALVTESPFSPPLPPGTPWQRVGVKQNLNAWKAANGFGADENSAAYFNAGDLGFGRSMHMRRNGANVAYYVSNHSNANQAAIAKWLNFPVGLIATVAMEYSPNPTGGPPYTKFYVFDNLGNRINKADLDAGGVKYVPNLCVVCHGQNTFPGSAANALNARFIPFDLDSFQYPTILFNRANQEADFKGLNRRILTHTNPTSAVTELVEGWYGGFGLPNATQNGAYVVPGWRLNGTGTPPGTSPVDKSALYLDVVKPSCRSCHITRNGTASWSRWDGPGVNDGFKERGASIRSFVCGPNRVMPNARLTYSNFWLSTSPHQPAALGAGGLDNWPPGSPCPQ
jgi:Carboxypeptidase regulatory-like domain